MRGFPSLQAIEEDVEFFGGLLDSWDVVTTLREREATVNRVHGRMLEWHDQLVAGDSFLFAFSGHGAQVPTSSKHEPDGFAEALVLFDDRYGDHSIRSALHGFRPGVRVYALIDACHASGVTFVREPDPTSRIALPVRRRAQAVSGATSLTLAAVHESELARQGPRGGLLIDCMRRTWAGGEFSGSWREFWDVTSRWAQALLQKPLPQAWLDGPEDGGATLDASM